jgi:hypothetical protein
MRIMMASLKQCLKKAEECARLTRYADTPQMRVALSNFERTWLRIADQCRRLEELIETVEGPAIAPTIDSMSRDSDAADLDPAPPKQQDDIAARLTSELAAEVRRRVANPTTLATEVSKRYRWPETSR